MKKKIIKIIVSMELMENIIFLFIQHVRIRLLVYSQKERKKNIQNTWPDCVAFFSISAVNESMLACSYLCVSILIPPEKSLDTKWFIVFFKCSRVFSCCGGSNRLLFSYLYCIFANSVSVRSLAVRLKIAYLHCIFANSH